MNDDEFLVCSVCGLQYEVIYKNDGQGIPDEYCPRCGESRDPEEER